MPFNLTLTPESTGAVFLSKESSINTVPDTPLDPDHPFHALWKAHLAELVGSFLYESVIDALVAICQGTPHWKNGVDNLTVSTTKCEMQNLLSKNPPDIVCVDGMTGAFSHHQRQEYLWPFIYISFDYVGLWTKSPAGSQEHASLTALLKTCLDHEIGHWVFSLRMGCFAEICLPVSNIKDRAESSAASQDLERERPELIETKDLEAAWGEEEEAGRYVEYHSRRGIMGYSKESKCAFMRTGPGEHDIHFLPMSYLSLYADNAIMPYLQLFFIPEETPPVEFPSLKRLSNQKEEIAFGIDGCSCIPDSGSIGLIESERRRLKRARRIVREILRARPKAKEC